jgi:hypothetical protein
MNELLTVLFGLDEPNKNKTDYKKKKIPKFAISTPGLNQGASFKKYQGNIHERNWGNHNHNKEGFQNNMSASSNGKGNNYFSSEEEDDINSLTKQSNTVLDNTMSTQEITDQTIQDKHKTTLKRYDTLLGSVSNSTQDYFNRVSSSNPYLNKYIVWTDPAANKAIMYVTNQGIAKPITDSETLKSLMSNNGCPDKTAMMSISLPWQTSYLNEGSTIPTEPPLVVGDAMVASQSCGNEGTNVYVDRLVTDSTASYVGCYADTSPSTMSFIGGAPPSTAGIVNGNFSHPRIKKNSYIYVNSATQVPGWNYNAVLVNNSAAWTYPIPYPNGDQCCSIQNSEYIEQTINLSMGSYTLSFMACGRNCCDGTNPLNISLNGVEFTTNFVATTAWTSYSFNFDVSTSGSNVLKIMGTNTAGDKSTGIQNVIVTLNSSVSDGTYTYEMCKSGAIDGGYSYFALQNVNPTTNLGFCGVSNNEVAATQNGTSYVVTGGTSIWSSGTKDGVSASLTNQGTLTVYNSSNTAVFNTDNSMAQPSDYLGCYVDTSSRAMPYLQGNMDYAACKKKATDNGAAPYFGLQNSSSGTNAECWLSSNITDIRKYGKATNCTKISDGTYSGGGWSNAIYSLDPSSFYYLILQDDGTMSINRGSGPNDNQGQIWSLSTGAQTKTPNPSYTAAKGKYGTNWMASGSTLAVNEFIGSTDGSIYLIMQPDGNLSLNTSSNAENCPRMTDGNMGGGYLGNALYKLDKVGIQSHLGKVGYIDSNSLLYTYPDTSLGLSTNYNRFNNYGSPGNDLTGTSFGNATVESCTDFCNNNSDCYGFAFDTKNNICYPGNKNMFPTGSRTVMDGVDLYVRQPMVTNLPSGVSGDIVNVDSVLFNSYPVGEGDPRTVFGLNSMNRTKNQLLDKVEDNLNQTSQKLVDKSNSLSSDYSKVGSQISIDSAGIDNYLNDYHMVGKKLKAYKDANITSMVNDSDINVLRENYTYLFWSILAVVGALLTMNIAKAK